MKLASIDQFRDAMDNSKTVWEEVSGGLDMHNHRRLLKCQAAPT